MPLVDWPFFVRNTTSVHGGFIDKKYIFKYMKISKIGGVLSFSLFWPALLASGFSIRILLPGYMGLDQPLRMLFAQSNNAFGWLAIFLLEIHPMYMVDSLTKNMFASIKISKIEAMLWGSQWGSYCLATWSLTTSWECYRSVQQCQCSWRIFNKKYIS